MKVLMITSEYPCPKKPYHVPFIKRQEYFLKKQGIDLVVFKFKGSKNPINYLKAYLQFRQITKKDNYDLVHAQFGQSGILALTSNLPLVVTFRGSDLEGIIGRSGGYTFLGRVLKYMSKLVAYRADYIILVAQSLAEHLPGNRSYSIIPSGLDLDIFKPLEKRECRLQLNWPLNKKIVLFGGRPVVKRKRFYLAQKAVRLAGESIILKSLNDFVPEMVPIVMNASDLLLLTSKHEGSPNVVKEALACNTPVVSVRVGDVVERLKHVEGCYLCNSDDPHEIAKGIKTTLNNSDAAFRGRKSVEHLDENLLTHQVINSYQKAILERTGNLVLENGNEN